MEVDIEGVCWGSRWILRVVCGGLVDIMWRVEVDIEGGMWILRVYVGGRGGY